MIRIKSILTLAILVIIQASCSTSKTTAKSKTGTAALAPDCRVWVSFYSIGSGRNAQAHDKFNAFIDRTNKEKNITLNTGATPWGREGEVDYCFKLKELKEADKKKFIEALKKELEGADFVRIEENVPNKNKR